MRAAVPWPPLSGSGDLEGGVEGLIGYFGAPLIAAGAEGEGWDGDREGGWEGGAGGDAGGAADFDFGVLAKFLGWFAEGDGVAVGVFEDGADLDPLVRAVPGDSQEEREGVRGCR